MDIFGFITGGFKAIGEVKNWKKGKHEDEIMKEIRTMKGNCLPYPSDPKKLALCHDLVEKKRLRDTGFGFMLPSSFSDWN